MAVTTFNYVVGADGNVTIGNGTITPGNAIISLGDTTTIPSEIAGHPVTAIGQHAFQGSELTSIAIPSTVTSIGEYAFNNCVKLTSVNIPNSVTTIETNAFTMTGLLNITIPSSLFNLTISDSYEGNEYFSNVVLISYKSYYDFYTWMNDRTTAIYNLGGSIFSTTTLSTLWQSYFGNNYKRLINIDGTIGFTFTETAYMLDEVRSGWNLSAYWWSYNKVFYNTYSSQRDQKSSLLSNYQTVAFSDYCVLVTADSDGILFQSEITDQLNGYKPGLRRCGSQQPSTPNLVVSFDSSVRSLEQVSFENTFISSIVIHGHIINLEYPLFKNCQYLTDITVTTVMLLDAKYYTTDGVLFSTSPSTAQTILIQYPIGKTTASYRIPSDVTDVATYAFANSTNLVYIHFPNDLITIGDGAFSGCSKFKGYTSSNQNINLVSVTTIGENAFNGCSSLTYVNTSDSVTSIGDSAFQNCSNLTYMYISRSITQINTSTFSGCSNLKSIKIPSLVTSIGASSFRYCSLLNDLQIGDWVNSIGAYAFDGCRQLSVLALPPAVVNLGTGAFTNCAQADFSVTMSNNWFNTSPNPLLEGSTNWNTFKSAFDVNINSVCVLNGYYAFSPSNGSTLTAMDVYNTISSLRLSSNYTSKTFSAYISNNVEVVGDGAFQICTNLKSIYMSTGVKTIGIGAFQGCSTLSTFMINNFAHSQLETIGDSALTGTDINMIVIPDSTKRIGKWAFYKCLIKELIFYPGTKIDTIDDFCFASCTNLKILRIPNTITTIGMYAFSNCIRLTEIILPSALETIGDFAFERCVTVSSLNIPDTVTTIGQSAFKGASSNFGALTISSQFKTDIPDLISIQNINAKLYNAYLKFKCDYDYQSWLLQIATNIRNSGAGNHRLLTDSAIWDSYVSPTGQYNSPTYDSNGNYQKTFGQFLYGLATLSNWGCQDFANYIINSITNATLNNDKTQSEDAWLNLQNTPVTYSDISSQDILFKYTFDSSTDRLTSEMVNAVISGYTGNFAGTITNNGTSIVQIAENAFANCNIVSIQFSDTLTEIASGAFRSSKLSGALSIPITVTTIGDSAFQDCSGITHIILPTTLETIGQNAFSGCGISYIIIPISVKTIGVGAFKNCLRLINVYVPIPPSPTPPDFYANYNNSSVYFNSGSVSSNAKYNYALDFYPGEYNNSITQSDVTNIIGDFTGNFVANINGISSEMLIDIDDNAFSGTNITSVIIGNYVESIGESAFNNCAQLTNASIGSGIQTIGAGAFLNCQKLQNVKMPSKMYNTCNASYFSSGTAIQYAYYCVLSASNEDGILTAYDVETQLGVDAIFNRTISITFDSSVHIIGDNAFNSNPWVDSIIIPPTIISIGNYAFANCVNMESLVCIGGDTCLLYYIGNYACYNCEKLSTVVLPLSLLSIGVMAFVECSNLYSVVLPSIFDYSYMTNTTAYFVTTNQKNAGWNNSTPNDATGTFFTFHFEMATGYFCSYSYEKQFYINQQLQNYNQEQAKKAAKKAFWTKIGWDLLTVVVLVAVTVATDGLGDTIVAGIMGEAMETTGATVGRAILTAGIATGLEQAEERYIPIADTPDGNDPFTNADESIDVDHSEGSWVATFAFTTTKRINVDTLSAYVETQISSTIVGLFGDRFINDPPIVDCTQTGVNQYALTLTLDIDFATVTDEDRTIIENVVNPAIVSFVNPDYIAPANEAPTTNVSVANVCFPANTPIKTDQGIVSIKKIDPAFHTINKNRIVAITQTITLAKYLICFKRDSLGKNYPAEDTIMSKEHKVYYMGRMIEAKRFVGRVKKVYKIPYNGEILYNVLMEKYNKLKVNNLICETLHPENVVAQLCVGNFNESDKGDIIKTLNNCIYKNSPNEYEALVKYIFKQANGEKPSEWLKQMSFSK
jgi:hypothetical protein